LSSKTRKNIQHCWKENCDAYNITAHKNWKSEIHTAEQSFSLFLTPTHFCISSLM